MNKTISILICVAALLAIAWPVSAKPPFTDADLAIQSLHQEQILDEKEQAKLAGYLTPESLAGEPLDKLEAVLTAAEEKVKQDTARLGEVLMYLTKLRDNKYTKTIAPIETYDFAVCLRQLEQLKADSKASDKLLLKYRVAMTTDEYLKSIADKSRFLYDSEQASVPGVWAQIRTSMAEVYGAWNEGYQELNKDVKKRPSRISARDISEPEFDKKDFMRLFDKLQVLLRRIAESGSDEF